MKPSALACGARHQPASARAPFRTAPHARLTLASPDASAPTTPLRTASTASFLHCISSSLPSLLLPYSCTAAGTQPDRAALRAPHHPHDARRTTHCHTISTQSPRARPSWLLLALEERGKGREAPKSQHASACAHCPSSPGAPPRTSRPRRCPMLALSSASTAPAPASCPHCQPLFYGPPLPRALFASRHTPCKHSCNAAHICNAAHMQCSTSCGQRCCCCGFVLSPARAGLGWAPPLNGCSQGLVVRGNSPPEPCLYTCHTTSLFRGIKQSTNPSIFPCCLALRRAARRMDREG